MATLNERASKSTFSIEEATGLLEIKDAVTRYRNFEGRINPNSKFKVSKRTFDIVVPADVAEDLLNLGWKIKTYGHVDKATGAFAPDLDDNGEVTYKLTVNVSYDNIPPYIEVCTDRAGQKVKRPLTQDDCSDLDSKIRIKSCNLVLNLSKSGGAYLRQLTCFEYVDDVRFGDLTKDYVLVGSSRQVDEVPFE